MAYGLIDDLVQDAKTVVLACLSVPNILKLMKRKSE